MSRPRSPWCLLGRAASRLVVVSPVDVDNVNLYIDCIGAKTDEGSETSEGWQEGQGEGHGRGEEGWARERA